MSRPERPHGTAQRYWSGCRCDPCREGYRTYLRERRAAVQAGTVPVAEHGLAGYDYGCRCDVCRAAKASQNQATWNVPGRREAAAETRRDTRSAVRAGETQVPAGSHGVFGYALGCRCAACLALGREYQRERKAASRAHTPRVVTVWIGHRRYEELLGPVRADAGLLRQMWLDAESELDEAPGKLWCLALTRDGQRWVAGAWAAAIVEDGVLRCCNSYESPRWRGRGLYEAAYRRRHETIVAPSTLPAVTYVYDQPLPLHLVDGWRLVASGTSRVDEPDGDGRTEHRWHELRR